MTIKQYPLYDTEYDIIIHELPNRIYSYSVHAPSPHEGYLGMCLLRSDHTFAEDQLDRMHECIDESVAAVDWRLRANRMAMAGNFQCEEL